MVITTDVAGGFYRFKDLVERRIVSSRSDLFDKQKYQNFPRPLKPGPKQALFLRAEVHEWALNLVTKRDAERRARLVAQTTDMDAKREEKPRKGIQQQGATVDK